MLLSGNAKAILAKLNNNKVELEISQKMTRSELKDSHAGKESSVTLIQTIPKISKGMNAIRLKQCLDQAGENANGMWAVVDNEQNIIKEFCAQMTIQHNRVLLHSLQSGPPPAKGLRVQYQFMRCLVREVSALTFIELAWGGRIRGCVFIRMFGHTGRGRQFTHLCTGQRGPCYKSTPFKCVLEKNKMTECLEGGDHSHDGLGTILDHLTEGGVYERPIEVGLVAQSSKDTAMFKIYCQNDSQSTSKFAFGKVELGMDTVLAACQVNDVTKITIANCGIVLPP